MPGVTPQELHTFLEQLPREVRISVFSAVLPLQPLEEACQLSRDAGLPLSGWTCFVKDNFDLNGYPTQASSTFLETLRPGPHEEGPLINRLRALGVVPAGKTCMNEFAYGLDGANPHVGDCPHPVFPDCCSGGSSSGSAWAVAKGLCSMSLGTDTGGSIRVPAAFCGIFGFRLPPDPWAQNGCFPLAPSYDSAGWFTKSLSEMQHLCQELLELPGGSPDLRVGSMIPPHPHLTPACESRFPSSTCLTPPPEFPTAEERVHAYNVLQSSEAFKLHHAWLEEYRSQYDPAVYQRIARAYQWTASDIREATDRQAILTDCLERLFTDWDVILLPVSLTPSSPRPMTEELRADLLAWTTPASIGGNPVLTVPVFIPGGKSLGIQCLLPPTGWKPILAALLQRLTDTHSHTGDASPPPTRLP